MSKRNDIRDDENKRTNLLPVLPFVNSHRASQNVVLGRGPPAFGGSSRRTSDSAFQSLRQNFFQIHSICFVIFFFLLVSVG